MSDKPLPSVVDLQVAWEDIQHIHKEYLSAHGVKLPQAKHYARTSKALWLAVLHHHSGQEVHKNDIEAVVRRDMPHLAGDQQIRHLKRDGWDIGEKIGIHKLNPYHPSPEFQTTTRQKQARLDATSFDDIKKAFGYCCATCGAREGQPNPRYGKTPVKLQQGHKDPAAAGDDIGNIIPQCQFCNRSYRGDFVFDDKGRVVSVNSIRPIKKARLHVQQAIYQWLKGRLK